MPDNENDFNEQDYFDGFYCIMKTDGKCLSGYFTREERGLKPRVPRITLMNPPEYKRRNTTQAPIIHPFFSCLGKLFKRESKAAPNRTCLTFQVPPLLNNSDEHEDHD